MPSSDTTVHEETALARAILYRFLAALYRYPDREGLMALREMVDGVRGAVRSLSPGPGSDFEKFWEAICRRVGGTSVEEMELEYARLFGHTPQGTCPLYGTEYAESEEGLQQPHELGDIMAFYRAFGLKLADSYYERVDFIAVECEFLSFLCQKLAYAHEHGDERLWQAVEDAQRKFFAEHFGRWVPAFSRHCGGKIQEGIYRAVVEGTLAFTLLECERLECRPGSSHLRLRLPVEDPDHCMSCPSAGACAPLVKGQDA
jgi:TorA maturation chaperone TorD